MSIDRAIELLGSKDPDQVRQGVEILLAVGPYALNYLAWVVAQAKRFGDLCHAVNRHRHARHLPTGADIDVFLLQVLDQWGDMICQECSGTQEVLRINRPNPARWVRCPDCSEEKP